MWASTRWDSRWETIDAVIRNYPAILRAFEEIIEEGGDRSIDARDLILAVKEPIFLVSLCVLYRLMGPIKILSDQLKSMLRQRHPSRLLKPFLFRCCDRLWLCCTANCIGNKTV